MQGTRTLKKRASSPNTSLTSPLRNSTSSGLSSTLPSATSSTDSPYRSPYLSNSSSSSNLSDGPSTSSLLPTNPHGSETLPRRSRSAPSFLHPVPSSSSSASTLTPNGSPVGSHVGNMRTLRSTLLSGGSRGGTNGSLGNTDTEDDEGYSIAGSGTYPLIGGGRGGGGASGPGSAGRQSLTSSATGGARRTNHQRTFNTWNKLQMGDQNTFHQTAHQVVAALAPKLKAGDQKKGAWRADELDSMIVEDTYTGPRLPLDKMTMESIMELVQFYKHHHNTPTNNGGVLHRRYAIDLLLRAKTLLRQRVTCPIVELEVGAGKVLHICGDMHGQLQDLLWIFHLHGYPSEAHPFIFNGDIADRGDHAVEIFFILFALMQLCPTSVYINRGNHEDAEMNELSPFAGGGFAKEVRRKYGGRTLALFQEIFDSLPLATIVNKEVFVVHGGLSRHIGVRLEHIRSLNHNRQPPVPVNYQDSIFFDMLWSDPRPQNADGIAPSRRGPFCITFGHDVTRRFLSDNNLSVCIRSHEVPASMHGFDVQHGGLMVTVFSASNYCGSTCNYGAVLKCHVVGDAPSPSGGSSPSASSMGLSSASSTFGAPVSTPPGSPPGRGGGTARGTRGGRAAGLGRGRGILGATVGGRATTQLPPIGFGMMMVRPGTQPVTQQALTLPLLRTLRVTAHEHWAPAMSELPAEEVVKPTVAEQELEINRRTVERAQSSTPRGENKMRAEILEKIRSRVVEKKEALLWHYIHTDRDDCGTVTEDEWIEGLEAVLRLDIPWKEYKKDLVSASPSRPTSGGTTHSVASIAAAPALDDGRVDYRRFLRRYRVAVAQTAEGDQYLTSKGCRAYKVLMSLDLPLPTLLRIFDPSITVADQTQLLTDAAIAAGVRLTQPQISEVSHLLRSMQEDTTPALTTTSKTAEQAEAAAASDPTRWRPTPRDLTTLFAVMFNGDAGDPDDKEVEDEDESKAEEDDPQVAPTSPLGIVSALIRHHLAPMSCIDLFEQLDANKDGFVTTDEFAEEMHRILQTTPRDSPTLSYLQSATSTSTTRSSPRGAAAKSSASTTGGSNTESPTAPTGNAHASLPTLEILKSSFAAAVASVSSPASTPASSVTSTIKPNPVLAEQQRLNLLQFCRAFYRKHHHRAQIAQRLYTILYENVDVLMRACRFYDEDDDGVVTLQEFKDVLRALNALPSMQGRQLGAMQIAIIAACADQHDDGRVKYAAMLNSLRVVDVDNGGKPIAGVRSNSVVGALPLPRPSSGTAK